MLAALSTTNCTLILVLCAWQWLALATAPASAQSATAIDDKASTGAIEGTVTYRADPQRPWRYARHYIRRPKTGELAEAVVALRGKSLAQLPREAQSQTAIVDQKNYQFVPETVAIRSGDRVQFTNSDPATHNVQVASPLASFNVNMPGGGSYTAQFDKAGGIGRPLEVGCVFHSAMRAYVFVFDHPFYQVTPEDGRFRLEGIPPGRYELEMSHPAGGIRWRAPVEVKHGQTLRVDIPVSPDDKQ